MIGEINVLKCNDDFRNEINLKEEKVLVGQKRKAGGEATGSKAKRSRLKKDAQAQVENLDMTSIHPESYHVADAYVSMTLLLLTYFVTVLVVSVSLSSNFMHEVNRVINL